MEGTSDEAIAAVPSEDIPTTAVADKTGQPSGDGGVSSTSGTDVDDTTSERGIDRLLQIHRNDIVYELRRLRLGDRPVTGNGAREAVEHLFVTAAGPPATGARARPEAVTVEVRALVERRPVSTLLGSARFTRDLHAVIRGALRGVDRRPVAPPGDQLTQHGGSPVARWSPTSRLEGETGATSPPPPPLPTDPNTPRSAGSTSRALSWLQHVHVEEGQEEAQERHLAERDNLVAEISELVHQHLVTSPLDSTFRERLEEHVATRLHGNTSQGQRVREAVQSLAASQLHRRNDFSSFGIDTAAPLVDNSDNISVISATATVSVPYAQSNAVLRHEMRALQTQMAALQQMMQTSFDLQLEMQRALRQEVAAGLSSQSAASSVSAASSELVAMCRSAREGDCLICLERPVDSVLCQCGHMCVCVACGLELRAREHRCPVCRAPIRDVVRVYRSNAA